MTEDAKDGCLGCVALAKAASEAIAKIGEWVHDDANGRLPRYDGLMEARNILGDAIAKTVKPD